MRDSQKSFEEKVQELEQLRERATEIIQEMTRKQLRFFINRRSRSNLSVRSEIPARAEGATNQ